MGRKKKNRKEKLNIVEVSLDDIPEKSAGYHVSKQYSIIDTLEEFLNSGFECARIDIPVGSDIGAIRCCIYNASVRNARYDCISVLVRCGQLYLVREHSDGTLSEAKKENMREHERT